MKCVTYQKFLLVMNVINERANAKFKMKHCFLIKKTTRQGS